MKKVLLPLFLLICVTYSTAQDFFTTETGVRYSADRIIVKIKANRDFPEISFVKSYQNLFLRTYLIYTDDLAMLERELALHPDIEYVERDFYSGQHPLPQIEPKAHVEQPLERGPFNDPQVNRLWSFSDAAQHGISINQAYTEHSSPSKQQIIVAVVDTGVDFNHEDLRDNMWKNPGEVAGNGKDDDDNGYIDDVYGINTLIRDSNGKATVDVRDAHSHGTHVSGTIAATQNNDKGVAGIATKAKIIAIRTVPNSSDEKDADVIEAFVYAAKNGAKIINCSFGKAHNEGGKSVSEAIDYIGREYGVLVVAAAGNSSENIDNSPTYPASFPNDNLLVVASTSSSGSMSSFSNFGIKSVDVAAPGSSIHSTTPNNQYSVMSGTSMASPTTAGVAAEVWSRYPHLTNLQLKKILIDSCTKVSAFNGKIQSGGRIDLKKALQTAQAQAFGQN